jgi:hypothetical protein
MPDHSKRTGPAIEVRYQFVLWLVPTIDRFPKAQVPSPGGRRWWIGAMRLRLIAPYAPPRPPLRGRRVQ